MEVIDSARLEFERCLGGRQCAQKPEGSAEPTSSTCALKAPQGGDYASRWGTAGKPRAEHISSALAPAADMNTHGGASQLAKSGLVAELIFGGLNAMRSLFDTPLHSQSRAGRCCVHSRNRACRLRQICAAYRPHLPTRADGHAHRNRIAHQPRWCTFWRPYTGVGMPSIRALSWSARNCE
jgi:hypothetical protein